MKKKAAFVVMHDDTHFIMIMRRGGELGFPGGAVEDGETCIQAARREANEEMNISQRLVPIDSLVISVEETKKFECFLFMTPEVSKNTIDNIVSGFNKATHSKEVSGVLLLEKKEAVINNLIKMFPLAPTVKEELEELKKYI